MSDESMSPECFLAHAQLDDAKRISELEAKVAKLQEADAAVERAYALVDEWGNAADKMKGRDGTIWRVASVALHDALSGIEEKP